MQVISEIRLANLEALMKRYSSIGDFNEAIGRKREDSTIRQVLKGTVFSNGYSRVMGDAVAREIEAHLALPRGWMDHDHPEDEPVGEEAVPLQVFRAVVSEGEVAYVPEDEPPGVAFLPGFWSAKLGLRPEELQAVSVRGDWMAPRVPRGSVAFVKALSGEIPDAAVCLVRYFSGTRIAQVRRLLDGSLQLHFENPAYPDERVPPEADPSVFSVLGRVVAVQQMKLL